MTKYHISPASGRPNVCKADKKPCPLGASTPHFESKEEAKAYIEKQAAAEHEAFTTVSKKKQAPVKKLAATLSERLAEARAKLVETNEAFLATSEWKRSSLGGRQLVYLTDKETRRRLFNETLEAEEAFHEAREAEYQAGPKAPRTTPNFPQAVGLEEAQVAVLKGYSNVEYPMQGREQYHFAPREKMGDIVRSTLDRWRAGERIDVPRHPDGSQNSTLTPYRDKLLAAMQEGDQPVYIMTRFPEDHLAPVVSRLGIERVSVSPAVNSRENGLVYTVLTPTGETRSFLLTEHRNSDALVIHGKTNWNPEEAPHGPYAENSKHAWFAEYSLGEYRQAAETLGYFLKEAQEGRLESDEELMGKAEGLDWTAIIDKQIPGFASWSNEQEIKRRQKEGTWDPDRNQGEL